MAVSSRFQSVVPLDIIKSKSSSIFNVTPCDFQARTCQLQLQGKHVILISPTGSGKSITFLMPFIWQTEGICLLISPLQLLGGQHAVHPALDALGVKAINLTSETASDSAFKDIAAGKYPLVITSPEYVEQDYRFKTYLWKSASFCKNVARVIFDEAHCVMDWGGFRPSYQRLCFLRPQLPGATFLALSATLTPAMVRELKSALCLYDVEVIRRSNDRPNILPIVSEMKYTIQSLADITFLIPRGLTPTSPPPKKFMLFMNSREMCIRAGTLLRSRLPPELEDKVVWVHSDMTRTFNEKALEDLRAGRIYGIVCTDVAGMGIDIPDIELVVQYQLPDKFCTLFQRFGRGARSILLFAVVILIVESKYFDDTKKRLRVQAEKRERRTKKRKEEELLKANELVDAMSLAGTFVDVKPDISLLTGELIPTQPKPPTYPPTPAQSSSKVVGPLKGRMSKKRKHSIEDVMDNFINCDRRPSSGSTETECRRTAANHFFGNPARPTEGSEGFCCHRCCPPPPSPEKCCDNCSPGLRDILSTMEKPAPIPRDVGPSRLPQEDDQSWTNVDEGLQEALEIWRDDVCEALWGPYHIIGGAGILSDEQVDRIVRLARAGLIATMKSFKRELVWHYHTQYATEVLAIVHTAYPPPRKAPEPLAAPKPDTSADSSSLQASGPSTPAVKKLRTMTCTLCRVVGHTRASLICPNRRERILEIEHEASTRSSEPPAMIVPSATSHRCNPSYIQFTIHSHSPILHIPSIHAFQW